MKAMILAAGKNTRLKGFENGCPKVLLKVHGRTILERNLIYLKKAGFKEVVVNLHYQSGLIRDFLEKNNHGLRIHFSYEKTLMGTAGALKLVREKFRGRACLVLYGDNLTDIPLKKMIQFHRARKAKITLGMYRPTETLWSGIAAGMIQTDVQGRITAFLEKRSNQSVSAAEWVNAGVLVVSPAAVKSIPARRAYDFSKDLLPQLLQKKQAVFGFSGARYVLASDTVEAYKKTCKIAEKLKF